MSQPTPYTRGYSFSNWSATHPNKPQPGVSLDTEFEAVEQTLGQVCTNLAMIQRDDGALANGIVGNDQLSAEIVVGLRSVSDWSTGASYVVLDAVWYENDLYRCLESHTAAAAFATDLAADKWVLLVDMGPYAQGAAEAAVSEEVIAALADDPDIGALLSTKAGLTSVNTFTQANTFSGAGNNFAQSLSLLGGFIASVSAATSSAVYWVAQPTDYAPGKPRVVLRKSTTASTWELQVEDGGGVAGVLNLLASTVQINGAAPWTAANFTPADKLNVADLPDIPTETEIRRIATRRALVF